MARDTSFYYAFLMLPPAKRNAIVAVWDFCRAVDDAVDEVAPEGEWPLSPAARAKAEQERDPELPKTREQPRDGEDRAEEFGVRERVEEHGLSRRDVRGSR